MSKKANRVRKNRTTVKPTQISTISEAVTLATPKATVSYIGEANMDWLDRATRSAGQYEVLA